MKRWGNGREFTQTVVKDTSALHIQTLDHLSIYMINDLVMNSKPVKKFAPKMPHVVPISLILVMDGAGPTPVVPDIPSNQMVVGFLPGLAILKKKLGRTDCIKDHKGLKFLLPIEVDFYFEES